MTHQGSSDADVVILSQPSHMLTHIPAKGEGRRGGFKDTTHFNHPHEGEDNLGSKKCRLEIVHPPPVPAASTTPVPIKSCLGYSCLFQLDATAHSSIFTQTFQASFRTLSDHFFLHPNPRLSHLRDYHPFFSRPTSASAKHLLKQAHNFLRLENVNDGREAMEPCMCSLILFAKYPDVDFGAVCRWQTT